MQERHANRKKYFDEQIITTEKYVIPYIDSVSKITPDSSILEIGCGEGGNLEPFVRMGCKRVVGIDLSQGKIEKAKTIFKEFGNGEKVTFLCEDIYNINPEKLGKFDVIITRDVIEHIHNQDKFMGFVKSFMNPKALFFLGFPPWYNPFGGHQQVCKSKILSKLPYFHILPKFLYKGILSVFGERKEVIAGLLEVKETGITTERLDRILKKHNYKTIKRTFYFINPNYEVKFGLKPKEAWRLISAIPFVRNFLVTANYYLVSDKDK